MEYQSYRRLGLDHRRLSITCDLILNSLYFSVQFVEDPYVYTFCLDLKAMCIWNSDGCNFEGPLSVIQVQQAFPLVGASVSTFPSFLSLSLSLSPSISLSLPIRASGLALAFIFIIDSESNLRITPLDDTDLCIFQEHSARCIFRAENCPDCDKGLSYRAMASHRSTTCAQRKVGSDFRLLE